MKKSILAVFLLGGLAFGQGARFDNFAWSTQSVSFGTAVVALPGASVQVCTFPANTVPCSNFATTYTDQTLGTQCPSNAQLIPSGGGGCQGAADSQGNFGFWAQSGLYDYTICSSAGCSGPYHAPVSPVNGSSVTYATLNGIVFASQFANFQAAASSCSVPCTVDIDAGTSVTANYSIPTNVSLLWTGGSVAVPNGVTLTFQSNSLTAPENQQVFTLSGTGSVTGMKTSRPEWFGSSATIRTAVTALDQLNGGVVYLRKAIYRSGFEDNAQCGCGTNVLSTPYVTIQGIARPIYNSTTAPTAFISGTGTIIQGTLNLGADKIKLVDLGVDVGPTFVNANYGSSPDNGIALAANLGHGQWQAPQFIRVAALGFSSSAAFHAMLVENVNQAIIEDITTRFNTHGLAFKGTNSKIDGVDAAGHGSDDVIFKADTSIPLGGVNVGKIIAGSLTPGDSGGVRITAGTASVGGPININQIITNNTFFGLLADQVNASLNITYLNVDSLQMDAAGVGANSFACFQVSTQLIYANIGKIKCTNTGYVVEGNTGTFSNPDFINIGQIVGVNQHTAAISVALGGRWKFGVTNLGGTQASPVIAANNFAKLQWCLNCLYADGWSTTFAAAAGGASIDLGIDQAAQFGATCSTTAVAGNVCTGNASAAAFTWPAATWTSVVAGFPDAGYVVTCTGANGGTGVGTLAINSYNATSVTTATAAITAAAAKFNNVECHGRE